MATPLYLLKVMAGGIRGRIMINNIQAWRAVPAPTKSARIELNPSIVEGRNVIELYMGPGRDLPKDANLDLKVVRVEGGKGGKETKLVAHRWDPDKVPMEAQIPSKMWVGEFKADKAFGRWSWQDASDRPANKTDEADIAALVGKLHQALSDRDVAGATALMRVKIEELGRAYGVATDDMMADQRAFLETAFAAKDWQVEPFAAGATTLVPAADGRVYMVTSPTGLPLIRAKANKEPIAFPLAVSRIGGAWAIVR